MFDIVNDVDGVSQKVKAAIKTKLTELGVCMEDELPDYIMIMIVNKKTKEQMNDDLTLFLGENTEKFTSWLCELLNRLQSISFDGASSTDAKNQNNVTTSSSAKSNERETAKKSNSANEHEDILAIKPDLEDDLFEEELIPETSSTSARSILLRDDKSTKKTEENTSRKRKIVRVPPATQFPEQRRGPSSKIGAVLQHPNEYEEVEYDPSNPAVGKVASVVKVSDRKSSVPVALQANKSLLFKAINEARISVAEKLKPDKASSVMQVEPFIESKRKVPMNQRLGPKFIPKPVVEKDIFAELSDNELDVDQTNDIADINVITGNFNDENIKPNINERIILASKRHKRITFDSMGELEEEKPTRNTSFIITLDGVQKTGIKSRLGKVPKRKRFDIVDDDIDMASASDSEDYPADDKRIKLPERCKFWPACKNGDSCEFHHPTTNCKTFPNCKFADKCIYIHPNCKFDSKCSKENCPFTHASKRSSILKPAEKLSSVSKPSSEMPCKFFPNCTKMDCPYKHMKLCRYGYSCNRSDCHFSHPTLPAPDKMKWNANAKDSEIMNVDSEIMNV